MAMGARFITFLFALLIATLDTCNASNECCGELEVATSTDKVLLDTSSNYTTENSNYWSSTCVLTPKCIFTPTSSYDVSTAIQILTRNNCQFAVRGGGHTPNPGWAGTSSGVLISLSKLNTVQVSNDAKSVVIGAGSRWGDIYPETGKHNVTVAGGRIPPVGVSGFLLGGGLSFLMHRVGFAANSVLSYEIVLANGTVATVTETSNGDLFKALKGGSGNFGIVTSFHLKTYPVNDVYAGNLHYTPDHYDKLFPLIESYARDGTKSNPKSHLISLFVNIPSQSLNRATFYAFYSDPVTAPPPSLKPFVDIPTAVNTLKVKTVQEATVELSEAIGSDQRYYFPANSLQVIVRGRAYTALDRYGFSTYSIRANAALFKQILDLWQSASDGQKSTSGWFSALLFQPVSNSMIRASNERGGNVLGIQPMDDPLIVVSYTFAWSNATDDEKAYATIEKLTEDSKEIARSQGKLADYIYLNYANTGQQVLKSYGQPQVEFLRSVAAKYDPEGVFNKLSPGGFKIPL